MKRIRPWIYFVAFITAYAALSTRPELDEYFLYLWISAVLILSAIYVWL